MFYRNLQGAIFISSCRLRSAIVDVRDWRPADLDIHQGVRSNFDAGQLLDLLLCLLLGCGLHLLPLGLEFRVVGILPQSL